MIGFHPSDTWFSLLVEFSLVLKYCNTLTLVTGNFQTFLALATAEVICLALARKLLEKKKLKTYV